MSNQSYYAGNIVREAEATDSALSDKGFLHFFTPFYENRVKKDRLMLYDAEKLHDCLNLFIGEASKFR